MIISAIHHLLFVFVISEATSCIKWILKLAFILLQHFHFASVLYWVQAVICKEIGHVSLDWELGRTVLEWEASNLSWEWFDLHLLSFCGILGFCAYGLVVMLLCLLLLFSLLLCSLYRSVSVIYLNVNMLQLDNFEGALSISLLIFGVLWLSLNERRACIHLLPLNHNFYFEFRSLVALVQFQRFTIFFHRNNTCKTCESFEYFQCG